MPVFELNNHCHHFRPFGTESQYYFHNQTYQLPLFSSRFSKLPSITLDPTIEFDRNLAEIFRSILVKSAYDNLEFKRRLKEIKRNANESTRQIDDSR